MAAMISCIENLTDRELTGHGASVRSVNSLFIIRIKSLSTLENFLFLMSFETMNLAELGQVDGLDNFPIIILMIANAHHLE